MNVRGLSCLLAVLLLPLSGAAVGPVVVQRALPGGAALLVSEQHALPIVQVTAILDAGSRRDPAEAFGVASLTADMLTEGAGGRSANEIAAEIEMIGGSLSAEAGVDYTTVSLRVLRKDLDIGLELLADVLTEPAFEADELERAREATLAALRAVEDDSTEVANREFGRVLYGAHPYAHPVEGDAESVAAITPGDLRRFWERHYVPSRAALVVVGDVEVDDIERRLAAALAAWSAGATTPAESFSAVASSDVAARRVDLDRPVSQASIVLGHRGIARSDPDFEAVEVMNYVLGGGGFSSRLMEKIRNQAGLVYGVSSYFSGGQLPGSFRVIMQTKNQSVPQAIDLARAEIEAIGTDGITAEELEDAKRYLTGSFPLSLDSNAEIAAFIARAWFLGLGVNAAADYLKKIEAVTLADVSRVAAAHLRPAELLTVVVANLAEVPSGESAAPVAASPP